MLPRNVPGATEAGAAAFRAGGNAIDEALAAAATLCVVYPHNVALGGDLVALVKDPAGKVHFLNATGTAPSAVDADELRAIHGQKLPLRGIDTITMPGGVRGWEALHELGANLTWADHLQVATSFAADGVPVSRSLHAAITAEAEHLLVDPGASNVFAPSGRLLAEGDTLRQTGTKWIDALRHRGSRLSAADAANYRPQFDDPIESSFGKFRIVTSPPNTSGLIRSRAMNIVKERIDAPLVAGAAELVGLDYGGDVARSLTPTGDTVGLSAASVDGWAVSLINSLFYSFGAGILDPETGVLFQNRGTSFSLDPASPNVIAADKRPSHTLMPVLVFEENELIYVPSTMGGAGQPQIHAQLLLRMFGGASPAEAINAPRFVVREPEGPQIRVIVEADFDSIAVETMVARGYAVEVVPPHTELLGHSNMIELIGGGYRAASDPRADGSALIVSTD